MDSRESNLLMQAINGDRKALGALLELHYHPLFGYFCSLTKGDAARAEDLTQETIIKVISNIEKYKPVTEFKYWLFRIARNTYIDLYRKKSDQPGPNEFDFSLVQSGEDTGKNLESREFSQTVRAAINALPDEQKEVVLLKVYADLTFKEISEIQGCPINTALARMRYALMALKKTIRKESL